jgi:hypothetical protein
LRLLASGDPQSAGEGRDDDGRQRSNRRLIRFTNLPVHLT